MPRVFIIVSVRRAEGLGLPGAGSCAWMRMVLSGDFQDVRFHPRTPLSMVTSFFLVTYPFPGLAFPQGFWPCSCPSMTLPGLLQEAHAGAPFP